MTAKALQESGAIDAANAEAIAEVADAIDSGKRTRNPTPELALEVDYATQLTVGQLRSLHTE